MGRKTMIHELKNYYVCEPFPQHKLYKSRLLDYFDKAPAKGLIKNNLQYENSIHKLDYADGMDLSREWVQMILHDFSTHIGNMASTFGFKSHLLHAIWFQQYLQGNQHDWHTHGENYSGVYYVELPDDCLGTEIWNGEDTFIPNVREGDICIFPAFQPHKSPKIKTRDMRKTIISFNFELKEFKDDFLQGMNSNAIV